MSNAKILRVRVSLRGRPMRSYVFNKDCVMVGRSPDADVSLDNPSVSREHCKVERSPSGSYVVQDLNSANGTFVNETQIQRQYIQSGDVVRIGKYSLWMSMEEERRGSGADHTALSGEGMLGTTVLRTSELNEMMRYAQETEKAPPTEPAPVPAMASGRRASRFGFALVVSAMSAFVLGTAFGITLMWMALRG